MYLENLTRIGLRILNLEQSTEAELDRFFMKLSMGYPSKEEERDMVNRFINNRKWREIDAVIGQDEIVEMQQEITNIEVNEDIIDYILNITEKTRNNEHRMCSVPSGISIHFS